MKKYNISLQVAVPFGPASMDQWAIKFRGVGTVEAHTAPHALRIAKGLGWRAPAVSPTSWADPELPPLTAAPSAIFKQHRLAADTPALPARYLRLAKENWR